MYVPIVTQNINEVTANIDIFLLAKFLQKAISEANKKALAKASASWAGYGLGSGFAELSGKAP